MSVKCLKFIGVLLMLLFVGCLGISKDATLVLDRESICFELCDLRRVPDERVGIVTFHSYSRFYRIPFQIYTDPAFDDILSDVYVPRGVTAQYDLSECIENASAEFAAFEQACHAQKGWHPIIATFYQGDAFPRSYYVPPEMYEKVKSSWRIIKRPDGKDVRKRGGVVEQRRLVNYETLKAFLRSEPSRLVIAFPDECLPTVDVSFGTGMYEAGSFFRAIVHHFRRDGEDWVEVFLDHVLSHLPTRMDQDGTIRVVIW